MKKETLLKKYYHYFNLKYSPNGIYECFMFGSLNFLIGAVFAIVASYFLGVPLSSLDEYKFKFLFLAFCFLFIPPFFTLLKSKRC